MCDGTAKGRLMQYEQVQAEAQKFSNEQQVQAIIYQVGDGSYAFTSADRFYSEHPGVPIELVAPKL